MTSERRQDGQGRLQFREAGIFHLKTSQATGATTMDYMVVTGAVGRVVVVVRVPMVVARVAWSGIGDARMLVMVHLVGSTRKG